MDESDVRSIVRLLGDPILLSRDLIVRKQLLLSKLARLIGADGWSLTFRRAGGGEIEGLSGRVELDPALNARPAALTPWADDDAGPAGREIVVRQIIDDVVSCIKLSRRPAQLPFRPRESRIAQIILTETSWLHDRAPVREKPATALSARQHATLIYLAEGLSRRAIAERLCISRHTVDDYVKAIYRHYRVNSRATLIKRFAMIGGAEGVR